MQVEALYDHGQLTFNRPIRFATARFPVILEIPDQAVLAEPQPPAQPAAADAAVTESPDLLAEIRHILGPLSKRRSPVSTAEDKAALAQALAEKHGL